MSSLRIVVLLVIGLVGVLAADDPIFAVGGVKKDEKGTNYIMANGQKWVVLGEEGGKGFFVNEASKEISWNDPRIEPSADQVNGVKKDDKGRFYVETEDKGTFFVYKDKESKKLFFHNPESETTTWDDPRIYVGQGDGLPAAVPQAPAKTTSINHMFVALFPVILFIGGVAARIYYLHTHYPELLFPTKERRNRARTSGGKFKAQKARGKMSQDGKGGRSANS